ncbi:MAG: ATP-dependent DNA helicase RecG, partial [Acidobacteria bacterium]|nr:ATP-dependent DNA helicase RecG [Acidobacteriota bacterium]
MDIHTPLMYVKGVGPARAEMLAAKGLATVEDLIAYAPFRYEDRSNVKTIEQLAPGEMATVIGEVRTARVAGFQRRALGMFEATFRDRSPAILLGKWFHGAYLANVLVPGLRVALYGKVELDSYSGELSMLHPEFEILTDDEEGESPLHTGRVTPIYEAAGKVTTRLFRVLANRVLEALPALPDPLPKAILDRLKLPDYWTAARQIHFPPADSDQRLLNGFRSPAQFRMIFEEFFWLECGLALKKSKARQTP